jgi:hypothetical protein
MLTTWSQRATTSASWVASTSAPPSAAHALEDDLPAAFEAQALGLQQGHVSSPAPMVPGSIRRSSTPPRRGSRWRVSRVGTHRADLAAGLPCRPCRPPCTHVPRGQLPFEIHQVTPVVGGDRKVGALQGADLPQRHQVASVRARGAEHSAGLLLEYH